MPAEQLRLPLPPPLPDGRRRRQHPGKASGGRSSQQPQQRCAIFNNVVYHMDVAAGMAWAFQVGAGRGG